MAGMWQHKDLISGVYSFHDLLDIHEALDVKQENQARARDWAKRQRERERERAAKAPQ